MDLKDMILVMENYKGMIKEMVRVLFSLAFGKEYVSVELEKENKYEVSGKNFLI